VRWPQSAVLTLSWTLAAATLAAEEKLFNLSALHASDPGQSGPPARLVVTSLTSRTWNLSIHARNAQEATSISCDLEADLLDFLVRHRPKPLDRAGEVHPGVHPLDARRFAAECLLGDLNDTGIEISWVVKPSKSWAARPRVTSDGIRVFA
jgi:hypothetical protein